MSYETSSFSPMKLGYRNTRCHWGTHIACLYENDDEKYRLINGFLCRGLHDGDFLLYCPDEKKIENFKSGLLQNCPEFRVHMQDPDRINIVKAEEVFYPHGEFARDGMEKTVSILYERQHAEYHRNIRLAVEMSWLLNVNHSIDDQGAYEEEMNLLVPGKEIVTICLYNLEIFSKEMIMKVLASHPYTISRGIMTRSSYFEPPTHYMSISDANSSVYRHATGF